MANTIALTLSIADDHESATITDSTSYSSPARNTLGMYINVYKVSFQGEETLIDATTDDSDPETDSTWTFDFSQDGHYRFKAVLVPDWAVTSYNRYDAVFDSVNNIVYRSKVNANSVTVLADLANTTNWEVISDPATLADNNGETNESANMDTAIVNRVIGTLTADARDAQAVEAALECCLDCERKKDVDLFTLLDVFAEALVEADSASEFNKGERIARRAEALI